MEPGKISIVYPGWQHFLNTAFDNCVLDKYRLIPHEYVFSLGSRSQRKNDRWIIAAAKQNKQYKFVISGSTLFDSSASRDSLPDNVVFTGYITDAEIKALMANCLVFLQPSFIEGFGIPPMEAMSTGARCIVSNTSALPEVYRDSVWYIDPYNYDGIDLDKIMDSKIEGNDVVLSRFSWHDSAMKLAEIINEYL